MDIFTAFMVLCLVGVGFLIRKELKRSDALDAKLDQNSDSETTQ